MTTDRWIIKRQGWDPEWSLWENISFWFSLPTFGSDELDNHSIYMTLFGIWIVFFYGRHITPKDHWYFSGCGNDTEHWCHLEYAEEGYIEMPISREGKRFMLGYDHLGIEEDVCPPAPIPPKLMDHFLEIGHAKFKPWEDNSNE